MKEPFLYILDGIHLKDDQVLGYSELQRRMSSRLWSRLELIQLVFFQLRKLNHFLSRLMSFPEKLLNFSRNRILIYQIGIDFTSITYDVNFFKDICK